MEESGKSFPQWPCVPPGVAVGVAPFRNLTGDAGRQCLVEGFTDRLLTDLFRRCRGLSLAWAADEPHWAADIATPNPAELKYLVTGSVLQRDPRMLRVNMRIRHGVTGEYLWAGRHESRYDDLASIQQDIAQQISRKLKILRLEAAGRDAIVGLGVDPGVEEALSRAAIPLRRGIVRAELIAEAQRWFLAALASDPRDPRALSGFAYTCQNLVSNPCWADACSVAAAFDLGHEAVAIALELEPGNAFATWTQGMLYSAARDVEQAAAAFRQALTLDPKAHAHAWDGYNMAHAHAWHGYNMAFLGHAEETLPAIERAMRLDPSKDRRCVWSFFGGFAELLLGRTEAAIALLNRALQNNPTHTNSQFFLMVALLATGRRGAADLMQESLRQHYPGYSVEAFERLFLSRSASPVYRAQVYRLFENIWALGAASQLPSLGTNKDEQDARA
jgi:TolB-like protein